MPETRLDPTRRRFLALSSLSLASAALVGRGLVIRHRHGSQVSRPEEPVLPAPRVQEPPDCPPEPPLPELGDHHVLTEQEAYTEFLASLGLRHITPREVIDPHWSDLNGISNELPPRHLWDRLPATLRVADEIRERLGVPLLRITSAYRSPRYNRQIAGAASRSFHTRNQALDLVFACSARKSCEVARQLRAEGFFKGGIGQYSTFLHIDTRGYNASWRKG